jgi:hypothetical protein
MGTVAARQLGPRRRPLAVHDPGRSLTGDPDHLAAMVLAFSHGVVDLDLSGHLRKRITPAVEQLVVELVARLSLSGLNG